MPKILKAKGIRKIVAERMLSSWQTSPVVLYVADVDMTNLKAFRQAYLEEKGQKVSVNVLFAKASALALKEYPYVNSSFKDNEITLHEEINVGFAVGIKDGVMVPNVKKCDERSLPELGAELDRLFEGARTGKVDMDDITGGTFTITNMGVNRDIVFHMPIINQPEMAIMGVYSPVDTPVVRDGQIVIRPIMKLALVADHRLIDGVLAGEFLSKVKALLESPELLSQF